MSDDLARRAEAEVRARHAFFVAWFAGSAAEADFTASARAFAPDMTMVEPDGSVADRDAVIAMLRRGRGARPGLAIEIVLRAARPVAPDTALVVYDEHQNLNGTRTARRSSAIFSRDEAAPEGVVWRHLHETWITSSNEERDTCGH